MKTIYCILHCPWCWRALRVMRWYPERWSSTICTHHSKQQYARLASRRASKAVQAKVYRELHENVELQEVLI